MIYSVAIFKLLLANEMYFNLEFFNINDNSLPLFSLNLFDFNEIPTIDFVLNKSANVGIHSSVNSLQPKSITNGGHSIYFKTIQMSRRIVSVILFSYMQCYPP